MYTDGISALDLHWLAGLLEGEASFFPGPPSSPRMPVISMAMTDEDVVLRAGRLLGRKVARVRPRSERWKESYQLRVVGGRAVEWMTVLRPLMGMRRQTQIDRAIASYDPRPIAVLTDETATEALEALAASLSVKEVAAQFNVSIWCIYDLRLARTYRHLPRPTRKPTPPTAASA